MPKTYTAQDVTPFPYSTRTPEEWAAVATRAEAEKAARYAAREESWERSDTDGFLTQWAMQSMGTQFAAEVAWALDSGTTPEQVLFNLDGTVASTHHKEGEWGHYWVLNDEAAERYGKRFFSESKASGWAKRAAAHAKKGFVVGLVRVNGWAPKLGGGMTPQAYSEGDWKELRAGRFEILHLDWLTELQRREDEQQARWGAVAARREQGRVELEQRAWDEIASGQTDEADPVDLADAARGDFTPGSEY